MEFSQILVAIGFVLMLHAAFSAVHFKGLAQLAGAQTTDHLIPLDVKLEVILSVLLTLIGTLSLAGAFVPFTGSQALGESSWTANITEAQAFHAYNHRNRFLRKRVEK
mmetsp:Transcript_13825/g.16749  ORF Transcript_13825/g.16749 Transcript_13825/m.16749 type:complete len:108 (+) Transcript_13825:91-414(+)